MCEAGLSMYGVTKYKYRYTLDVVPDMRMQLSTIPSNVKDLCETNKQHNSSHQ